MRNRLNRLFWSTNPRRLDVHTDQAEIIHHILAYGSIDDIRYLLKLYPRTVVKRFFLQGKLGYYSPQAVAFTQQLLNIPQLDYSRYVKKVSGPALRNPQRRA